MNNSIDYLSLKTNGFTNGIEEIKQSRVSAMIIDQYAPWMKSQQIVNVDDAPFVRLHNEMVYLNNYLMPTQLEKTNRESVLNDLQSIVSSLWPNSIVKVFGSQMTNLLIPHSDIDVTILNVPLDSDSNATVVKALELLANTINSYHLNKPMVSYVEVIANAKFPIVKFDHILNVSVDVCINNNSGVDTGLIIKKQLRQYPMLKHLTVIIKLFLAQRNLNETYNGGIGSFVLINMIISFIQQRQRLSYHLRFPMTMNLGVLLLDFMKYYGQTFNYATCGISINDGGLFNKKNRGLEWHNPNRVISLSVENPDPAIDPPIDIGKNSYMIAKIRRAFDHAYQVLSYVLSLDPSAVKSYLAYIIRVDDPCLDPIKRGIEDNISESKSKSQQLNDHSNSKKHHRTGFDSQLNAEHDRVSAMDSVRVAQSTYQTLSTSQSISNSNTNSTSKIIVDIPLNSDSSFPRRRTENDKIIDNDHDDDDSIYHTKGNIELSPEIMKGRRKKYIDQNNQIVRKVINIDNDEDDDNEEYEPKQTRKKRRRENMSEMEEGEEVDTQAHSLHSNNYLQNKIRQQYQTNQSSRSNKTNYSRNYR